MFLRKLSTTTQRHLSKYNPFAEFKSDVNKTIDRHIQMTNTILKFTMGGFGALGFGLVILYQKTETDKKELNDKIDNNTKALNDKIDNNTKELNDKLDLIMIQIAKPKKSWF